jgi:hypothetical protein
MKVFISWSGERSQIFAKALHEWLPMVLQSVVPWLSHADISAGDRWADTVAKELEASEFGITRITRENMSSPCAKQARERVFSALKNVASRTMD